MTSVFGRLSVAAVTPFDAYVNAVTPQNIDSASFVATITHIAKGLHDAKVTHHTTGIGGIIVTGTTGEQHSTTIEERMTLYAAAVPAASVFQIPIIAGIAATTTHAAVSLAIAAASSGCQGIMLGLPPYTRPNDVELTSYVKAVHTASSLPILLYNNSIRNGSQPSLATMLSWYRSGYIWGIKHAVSAEQFNCDASALLRTEPSMPLYTGSDLKSHELFITSHSDSSIPSFYGLTSIIANLYPCEVARMVSDMFSDDSSVQQRGVAMYHRLVPVVNSCLSTSIPVGLKYALRLRSNIGGHPRHPLGALSDESATAIADAVRGFDNEIY